MMRFPTQICCPSKIMAQNVKKKVTKAEVIKRMMKEHKATFGSLLETQQQKKRRVKMEKSGALIPDDPESSPGDSELAWVLKVSNSRLRVVKIDQNFQQYSLTETASKNKTVSIFTNENEKQTGIIEKTTETKVELSKTKLSDSMFSINSQLKSLPPKKSSSSKTVKVKILGHQKSSAAAKQNLVEIDIHDEEKKDKTSTSKLQENIRDKIIKLPLDEKSVQKDLKATILVSSEASGSSEQNINENDIQCIEEDEKTNSSVVLSYDDIIENINKAQLFYEEGENFDSEQSSEILSLSREQKEYLYLPSVTHILNATMSNNAKKMLELWTARMIQKLGQEGFNEYKRGLLQNGKLLHSVIDSSLRKIPVEIPDNIKACYTSVKTVLDAVEHVRAIESQVVHKNLGYRGVVDCVASYRGNLCLIDWKKSDKPKYLLNSTYDAPLQIASYIGALNADTNYPFQIKSGLLVIAYTIGEPSTVFSLDQRKLQYYWKQWLGRLKKYYTLQET